jgi:hypothetical protein
MRQTLAKHGYKFRVRRGSLGADSILPQLGREQNLVIGREASQPWNRLGNHEEKVRLCAQATTHFQTAYPNSPITGLPVENGGRMIPVFRNGSCSGTPSACSTVAWRSCGVTGLLFTAVAVLSDSP